MHIMGHIRRKDLSEAQARTLCEQELESSTCAVRSLRVAIMRKLRVKTGNRRRDVEEREGNVIEHGSKGFGLASKKKFKDEAS